jgi:hypothetical protein
MKQPTAAERESIVKLMIAFKRFWMATGAYETEAANAVIDQAFKLAELTEKRNG